MTNKKLWLSLLVVVLVVCMLSVSLFACNKDKDTPAPSGPSIESQAIDAIINGIKESVATGDMKDLKVDGTIGITLGDKSYSLALALELDLLQFEGYNYEQASGTFDPNGEYFTKSGNNYTKVEKPTEANFNAKKYYIRVSRAKVETIDKVTPSTQVTAELKEGNTTLLGLYYIDGQPGTADIYQGNTLYLQTKTKKVCFPAPFISAVQSAKDGQVDFSGIDLADEDAWGSVDTVTGIIGSLATNGELTDKKASITLDIATLLDPNNENNLLSLVSGLQDWLTALDLDINASELGKILPSISLVLSADLNNGKATGFDISLQIKEKDIEIKNGKGANTLLKVDMTKDVEVGLSLDYTIGSNPQFFWPSDYESYTYLENILDTTVSVDLFLSSGINMSLLDGKLTIDVKPGYYTLTLDIAANPFAIIEKINNGIDFSSTPKLIDSISEILQAVNALELKLERKYDGDHVAIPEANQTVLYVLVGNTYQDLGDGTYRLVKTAGKVDKKVTLKTNILGDGTDDLELKGVSVGDAIDFVGTFIDKGGNHGDHVPVSSTEVKDSTKALLQTIGGYLLGTYIGINDGTNGKIFASFDSTKTAAGMIPFSGYTKWTGDYNSSYKYYTLTTPSEPVVATVDKDSFAGHYEQVASTAKFDDNIQYYTKNDNGKYSKASISKFESDKTYYTFEEDTYYTFTAGHFEEVDQTKGFDDYVYYYTKSSTEYTRQDSLTEFAADTTYYVWKDDDYKAASEFKEGTTYYKYTEAVYTEVNITGTDFPDDKDYYVKGKADGGDFGIGLTASVKIDSGIEINAVVKNMDIFGLPATITAKINNLQISAFDGDYTIYFTTTTYGKYSDVEGHLA